MVVHRVCSGFWSHLEKLVSILIFQYPVFGFECKINNSHWEMGDAQLFFWSIVDYRESSEIAFCWKETDGNRWIATGVENDPFFSSSTSESHINQVEIPHPGFRVDWNLSRVSTSDGCSRRSWTTAFRSIAKDPNSPHPVRVVDGLLVRSHDRLWFLH